MHDTLPFQDGDSQSSEKHQRDTALTCTDLLLLAIDDIIYAIATLQWPIKSSTPMRLRTSEYS